MKPLEQDLARYLVGQSEKYTKAQVLERYAISYNTLRKIEAGLPLRFSLAQRLEHRLLAELVPTGDARLAHAHRS